MPTYTFEHTETGEQWTDMMSWDERCKYLEDNPKVRSVITAPNIVSGVQGMGRMKNDDGFKEVMAKIGEKNPGTSMADRYAKKSIKEIKTRQVLKKHKVL